MVGDVVSYGLEGDRKGGLNGKRSYPRSHPDI